MRRGRVALALFLAFTVAGALHPAAAQRSLEIRRFDARITVSPDASIEVTETIEANFIGAWNGIYRKVPVQYRTPQGFNWSIRLSLISATDGQGAPLRTETSREGHSIQYKMWVPGATDAVKTVVLRYRVENALRFFEEHDELYWNVTGDEWDVALGMVTAEIVLPTGATGIRATAFNGVQGATLTEAEIVDSGTSVSIRMPRPLEFREGLTAVVGWDKGAVAEPTAADRAAGFLATNWPLGIPVPVFLIMLGLWRNRGRDPRRRPIVVRYEPPPGLTAAEAGTLTDERVDMRDITATLVDLAVRGFIRIEQTEETALFGLMKNEDFLLHSLRPREEWSSLAPHERLVMEGIFESAQTSVALSDLKDEFYTELEGIRSAIMTRLVSGGMFRVRPDRTRTAWMVGGVIFGVVVGFAGAGIAAGFSLTPVPFLIAGALSAIIIMAFGWQMPARTLAGTRALEQVLGFEEFLERVEKERYQMARPTPEMFEKFLPYAMAFGVERQWAKAFDGLQVQPPTWYAGVRHGTFSASSFSHSISSMSTQAASTMSSSPRTSSGSGFSGGSSGGGGGGGGGGGF
ncbi:MAG TPA: DUF2207 domain-containing protein [Gemmatimonadales bacterium]|nr:DUF2207 domain-containing protein [Gemmatimonadales bacterium]